VAEIETPLTKEKAEQARPLPAVYPRRLMATRALSIMQPFSEIINLNLLINRY
jgi:hypothetical protein